MPTSLKKYSIILTAAMLLVISSASALTPKPANLAAAAGPTISVVNSTGQSQVIYFMVDSPTLTPATKTALGQLSHPCIYPANSFSGDGNKDTTCHFMLPDGKTQAFAINDISSGKIILAISTGKGHFPKGPCNTTLAEFTINDGGKDGYDISLVNGRSFDMQIKADNGQDIELGSNDPKQTLGVYPPGCSRCVDGIGVAPDFAGNGTSTQNCPGFGRPPGPMPTGSCKTGSEFTPQPNKCQIDSVTTGGNYTVTFQ